MMDRLPVEPRASLMKRRNKRMNDPINVALLGYGLAMTVGAAPILRYATAAAAQLLSADDYVREVRATMPQRREP